MKDYTFKKDDGSLVSIQAKSPDAAKKAFDKKYKSKGGGKSKPKKKKEE